MDNCGSRGGDGLWDGDGLWELGVGQDGGGQRGENWDNCDRINKNEIKKKKRNVKQHLPRQIPLMGVTKLKKYSVILS